jgi:hypothetical protein
MKKIFLLLAVICTVPFIAMAQHAKPKFSFNKEIHDFGTIQESNGKVEYSFEFTNIGGQPLVINNVSASCGCTTPDWSKMPIPPGGKGFIKATFDPSNRPGQFNKTVTVSSNAEVESMILRITGVVEAKVPTIEEQYPRDMGGLKLKAGNINFTKVSPGTIKTEVLEVYNSSAKDLTVIFKNIPEHLTVKLQPDAIKPGQKGVIAVTFDASKVSDWGFVVSQVYMIVGDPADKTLADTQNYFDNRLSISATIEEDFTTLTPEQLANAPVAVFADKVFDFGTIKQGQLVSKSFVLTNSGKSDLIIRKVKASCGCTAAKPTKSELKPGESTEIVTEFNSAGKSGHQNKSVTIITNDPKSSTVLLTVTGDIVVEASNAAKVESPVK